MTYYVGILDRGGEVWGVRVPDRPGLNGAGASHELAVAAAVSAAKESVGEGASKNH